jgi:hypothetical protein
VADTAIFTRQLKTQLEEEKAERQFAEDEVAAVIVDRGLLEEELAATRRAVRERVALAEREQEDEKEKPALQVCRSTI